MLVSPPPPQGVSGGSSASPSHPLAILAPGRRPASLHRRVGLAASGGGCRSSRCRPPPLMLSPAFRRRFPVVPLRGPGHFRPAVFPGDPLRGTGSFFPRARQPRGAFVGLVPDNAARLTPPLVGATALRLAGQFPCPPASPLVPRPPCPILLPSCRSRRSSPWGHPLRIRPTSSRGTS